MVGFVFDKRLKRGPMIDKVVKKARIRLAGLRRLRTAIDDNNMKPMYLVFIRSILEYGSISYMGAAKSHLDKLDQVQNVIAAKKLGNFKVESLQSRREAAAMSMGLKLLDGKGRGQLRLHARILVTNKCYGLLSAAHGLRKS